MTENMLPPDSPASAVLETTAPVEPVEPPHATAAEQLGVDADLASHEHLTEAAPSAAVHIHEPEMVAHEAAAAEETADDEEHDESPVAHLETEELAEGELPPEEEIVHEGLAEGELPPEEEGVPDGDEEEGAPATGKKHWYVVKVQSNREDTIREAIERRVKIEGLEEFFGQIVVPTEQVIEMRKGKRVKKERKLYPGYIMAEVEYNDRILYLFRETSGVGDFVGGTIHRAPPPMSPREIERMLGPKGKGEEGAKVVPTKPEFAPADRVRVKDGAFAGMEGEVKEILEAKGQVRVEVAIFGRPVSLELEYWQVEQI